MIKEDALWYKRGDLVEFRIHLGAGTKTCTGLVLNTAVLYGRGARQLWVVDMQDATPEQLAQWTNKKFIAPENEIVATIPRTLIGADTILKDNPVSYPVQNGRDVVETPSVTVTISLPSTPTS